MKRSTKSKTLKRFIQALELYHGRKLTRTEKSAARYFTVPPEKDK